MKITTQEFDTSVINQLVPSGQDAHFTDETKHIPTGGTLGQVVTKGVTNPEWSTPAAAGDPNSGRLQADFGFDGAALSNVIVSNGVASLQGEVIASRTSPQKTVTANGNACIKTSYSVAGKTVTAVGSAQIDTAQFKVGTSSGLFNGSSDNLSTADSDDWAFGTGDLTVQFWVRFNALPGSGSTQAFYGSADADPNNMLLALNNNAGTHRFRLNSKISGVDTDVYWNLSPNLSTNTWYHVALCRSGNNIRLFLDGVKQGSDQAFSVTMTNVPAPLTIGSFNANYRLNGWLDEFEIAKGVCRYSTDFTPPTTALVADSYTKLLLHFEGSDASTTFTDSSATVYPKIGTGMGYFDGASDNLSIPDSEDWNFGSGDFTIQAWVRFGAYSGERVLLQQGTTTAGIISWYVEHVSNTVCTIKFQIYNGGSMVINLSENMTGVEINTWHHLRVVRVGSSIKAFKDGVQVGSSVAAATMPDVSASMFIGSNPAGALCHYGWLDEFEIAKGVARDSGGAFTPPTSALVSDNYTVLLLHFEGADNSTTFTDDIGSGSTPAATSGTALKVYTPSDLDAWGNLKYTQVTPTNAAVATNVYGKNDSGTAQVAVSTVYTTKNLSVTAQDSAAAGGMFLSADGTKLYYLGANNTRVYQYTLSTPWDVSTGTYASKMSPALSAQDANPRGFYISSDGLNMYVYGSAKAVFQYTLGTAWDISTATYASKSFSVTAQGTAAYGVTLSSDLTKMYVNFTTPATIFQYTLSTAGDVSTASYASKSLSTTSQDSSPRRIVFNSTGTKLFVLGGTNQRVYQYALSTAWDLSTATYSSKSYLTTAQDSDSYGIAFSTDGTGFYLLGGTNVRVFQYALMSAFDIQALNLLKLKAGSSAVDNYYNTYLVRITGGTGIGQSRIVTDYTGSTLTAAMDADWTTQPDATSTYSLYLILKTGVTSIADLSDISAATYAELAVLWALSRVSSSDTTPTVATPSVTWEGSDGGWVKIGEITLSANAAQVDFSNLLPYKSFKLQVQGISSSTTNRSLSLRFNDDTGNNYDTQYTYGNNTSAVAARSLSAAFASMSVILPDSSTNDFGVGEFIISNHVATKRKAVIGSYGTNYSGNGWVNVNWSAHWGNVANFINKMSLIASGDNIGVGSRFILWGCK